MENENELNEAKASVLSGLWWERYRPKRLEDMALPQRLYDVLSRPLEMNLLLVGKPGTGKTTAARIITAPYDTLVINTSVDNSIDNLREEVTDFCNTYSLSDSPFKVVLFEEFDGATPAMQEGLRAFIEEKKDRVKWVATCNNEEKVTKAMKSRFAVLDFDIKSNELNQQKNKYAQQAIRVLNENGKAYTLDTIRSMVNSVFPDFRALYNQLQMYCISEDSAATESIDTFRDELFVIAGNSEVNTFENWDWVMKNVRSESDVDRAFELLGREFISTVRNSGRMEELQSLLSCYCRYIPIRAASGDPWMPLLGMLYEYQLVLASKNTK